MGLRRSFGEAARPSVEDDEEWDWPPPRRPTATLVVEAKRPVRKSLQTRIADGYLGAMFWLVKLIAAVALTAVVLACFWLIATLLHGS